MQRIESPHNEQIKSLLKLMIDPSYRKKRGEILLEGYKLSKEIAQDQKQTIVYAIEKPDFSCNEWIAISPAVAKKLAQTETSEGIFALIPLPKESTLKKVQKIVAFDAVSDPGNLGTLLRTALALNWDGIFFLPDCCDPFNPKVVRASKGALFKIPFKTGSWDDLEAVIKNNRLTPLAADLQGEPAEKYQGHPTLLILGNEGRGISEKTKKLTHPVTIPINAQIESLNVAIAGGILMYLLRGNSHG